MSSGSDGGGVPQRLDDDLVPVQLGEVGATGRAPALAGPHPPAAHLLDDRVVVGEVGVASVVPSHDRLLRPSLPAAPGGHSTVAADGPSVCPSADAANVLVVTHRIPLWCTGSWSGNCCMT